MVKYSRVVKEFTKQNSLLNLYGGILMRVRKQAVGERNIVGQRIEEKRKSIGMKQKDLLTQLQVAGIDLNASGLSKLEGQIRSVTDKELIVIAKTLNVSVLWLLGLSDEE